MTLELLLSQFLDPFRIGLLLALVITSHNTSGTVGLAVPLVLGAAFVAVLIPVTMRPTSEVSTMTAILTGFAVNAIVIGVIIAAWAGWQRLTTSGKE
jgi:hypothetical protein